MGRVVRFASETMQLVVGLESQLGHSVAQPAKIQYQRRKALEERGQLLACEVVGGRVCNPCGLEIP
jgi:hypothetical protein